MAIALVNLVMIPWYWIVPESPRWLLSVGRFAEAEGIIRKMSRWNRTDRDPNFEAEFRDRWSKVVQAFAAKIVHNEDGTEKKLTFWSTVNEIICQVIITQNRAYVDVINIFSAAYIRQRTLTIEGSITVRLTSCLNGLNSTKQVKLMLIKHTQNS